MVDAYVALGSNLGARHRALEDALRQLATLGDVVAQSKVYETEPMGGPLGQPWYLNMVVRIRTPLSAGALLNELLGIEVAQGRTRTVKNGPRTLDLDLLLWDDLQTDDPHLSLPHPRMHHRRFVLEPLAEVHPCPKSIVGLDFYRSLAEVKEQHIRCLGELGRWPDVVR